LQVKKTKTNKSHLKWMNIFVGLSVSFIWNESTSNSNSHQILRTIFTNL